MVFVLVQDTLSLLFSLYVRELPVSHGDADQTWPGRQGVALALHAAADVLTLRDLPVVTTFLISRALVSELLFPDISKLLHEAWTFLSFS